MRSSLQHEMVVCGQRHAFRLLYLRERIRGKLWTEGRSDCRVGPYVQEQSQLSKPELMDARHVAQTLYSPIPPCSIIIIIIIITTTTISMTFVKFCLRILVLYIQSNEIHNVVALIKFLLALRFQLYMFRTVTVHPQELLCRYCMCRLWYVL